MIRDWLSRAASAVVGGPLILLVPPVAVFGAVTVADKVLLFAERRRRARVRAAVERATAQRLADLVPDQRDGAHDATVPGQRRGEP